MFGTIKRCVRELFSLVKHLINQTLKKMKKITSHLLMLLFVSLALFSCSDDDKIDRETLTVKGTFEGTNYEKDFTVDADDIFTDTEGFTFELTWETQENTSFDVDFFADAQATGGDFNTGFDLNYTRGVTMPEIVTVTNASSDTFGKTHINLYSSSEDTITYTLRIKRISNNEIVKTVSGSVQSTSDGVDNASLIGSIHNTRSHGFKILGDFVKVGNKFYFSY